ncbi:MAG: hypothetical protein DLM73_07540 [Chthoniobacterales bacterium]|nr:MAG: hypothetical protein DLM73_07540 [Chthoniobacterales bacterium]
MNGGNFFSELKRRNVYKVAVAYAIVAWLLIQAASILFPTFEAPAWVMKAVVAVIALGFPIALIIAWAFEMTPEGMKRTEDVSPDEVIPQWSKRKFAALIVSVAVIAAGLLAFQFLRSKPASTTPAAAIAPVLPAISEKSIAVLPFENLSSDKENAYFADGIQDEILTRLSKIAALKVISRTSTQKYKSAPENLREVGRQLGVANLLEGSVQKIANSVHINVQLIRVATDEHIWAESYNRKLDDVFVVEGEVAGAIADQLNAKLTGAEKQDLADRPTSNPAAYDAYLRGLPNMARTTDPEALKAAVHSFDEAVRLDPQFALAWAALSRTHSLTYFNDLDKAASTKVAAEKSLAEAVRLKPELPETQLARADFYYWVLLDYKSARDMLEQLHRTWPSNAEILQVLGWISARLGEWKKSAHYLDEAIALNPRDLYLRATGCEVWMALRDFATATRKLDEALQAWPDDPAILTLKTALLQGRGQLDEAQLIVNRLVPGESFVDTLGVIAYQAMLRRTPGVAFKCYETLESKSNLTPQEMGYLLSFADLVEQSGDKARARAIFTRARDLAPTDNQYSLFVRAYALAGLGEREAALTAIDKVSALVENDARLSGTTLEIKARILTRLGDKDHAIPLLQHLLDIPYDGFAAVPLTPALLRLDPAFDSLRSDPRFEKLCQEKQP